MLTRKEERDADDHASGGDRSRQAGDLSIVAGGVLVVVVVIVAVFVAMVVLG